MSDHQRLVGVDMGIGPSDTAYSLVELLPNGRARVLWSEVVQGPSQPVPGVRPSRYLEGAKE